MTYRLGDLGNIPASVVIVVLKGYRAIISPLYGQVCRFFPSCSAYALEAVTVHGLGKGGVLAAKRLVRCHPWNDGGVDHVPSGGRQFNAGEVPRIVVLNHPDIPVDDESRDTASGAN